METFEMEVGGRKLTLEHGKMAKQANGAVLVRYGDTVVLVTATMSKEPREGVDFFPLTVDYEEKMSQLQNELKELLVQEQQSRQDLLEVMKGLGYGIEL